RFFYFAITCLISVIFLTACSRFLDVKCDKSLAIPETLEDLQQLLDSFFDMNQFLTFMGETGSDDYFISANNWKSISNENFRNLYVWEDKGVLPLVWNPAYKAIFICNTVLEEIDVVKRGNHPQQYYDQV